MMSKAKTVWINSLFLSIIFIGLPAVHAYTNDYMPNYVRGTIKIDGSPAPSGTNYTITVISGTNEGYSYNGSVDDSNVPNETNFSLVGNGYFDTDDQPYFNSGDTFRLSVPGYCEGTIDNFESGGNGGFGAEGVNLTLWSPGLGPFQAIDYNCTTNTITISGRNPDDVEYTEESFNLDSGNDDPWGIAQNGTYLWISDYTDGRVYKYYINGTYANDYFNCSGATGVTTNNTYIWCIDWDNGDVEKYNMNGTFTGDSFDLNAQMGAGGQGDSITQNGTFFWITNWDSTIYRYTVGGTFDQSFDVSTSGVSSASGITTDNEYIYITDGYKIYKYYMNLTYTGVSNDISAQSSSPEGIVNDGTYFWVLDYGDKAVYKYWMEGPYTFTDIYDADQANGWRAFFLDTNASTDKDTFRSNAKLYLNQTILSTQNEILIMDTPTTETDFITVASGSELRVGKLLNGYTSDGSTFRWDISTQVQGEELIFLKSGSKGYFYDFKSSYLKEDRRGTHLLIKNGATVVIKNGVFEKGYYGLSNWDTDTVLDRVWFFDVYSALDSNSAYDTPPRNIFIYNPEHGLYFRIGAGSIYNAQVFSSGTNDVAVTLAPSGTIVDGVFDDTKLAIGTSSGVIYDNHTVNIEVMNESSSGAISGANVSVYDKNNNSVFSVLTGSDGRIDEQSITRRYWTGTSETLTDLSPHTIQVTATGYQSSNITTTIDRPLDLIIPLKSS